MKKLSLILSGLCIASFLFSCGSSPFDEAVTFLDKHDVALYFCGNESNVYTRLENCHDFSPSEFPESCPYISSFIIDVENKRDIITTDFLD